jgi:hypothetical protein
MPTNPEHAMCVPTDLMKIVLKMSFHHHEQNDALRNVWSPEVSSAVDAYLQGLGEGLTPWQIKDCVLGFVFEAFCKDWPNVVGELKSAGPAHLRSLGMTWFQQAEAGGLDSEAAFMLVANSPVGLEVLFALLWNKPPACCSKLQNLRRVIAKLMIQVYEETRAMTGCPQMRNCCCG